MLRGTSVLSALLSEPGARVARARQPPLPPALPSPSLAGRRQLCGCSAHLPPPESRALKLPGCGQPCCHGNCILHPYRRLHLKAIGENRGTRETEEGEKTVAWPHGPSLPPSLPSPPSSQHPVQDAPTAPACPSPARHRPETPGPPCWQEVRSSRNLTDSSAPGRFNTCWALSTLRRRGCEKAKPPTSKPGP